MARERFTNFERWCEHLAANGYSAVRRTPGFNNHEAVDPTGRVATWHGHEGAGYAEDSAAIPHPDDPSRVIVPAKILGVVVTPVDQEAEGDTHES